MGTWRKGLYSNDTACDVRDEYRELIENGKSGEQAAAELCAMFAELIEDEDD